MHASFAVDESGAPWGWGQNDFANLVHEPDTGDDTLCVSFTRDPVAREIVFP